MWSAMSVTQRAKAVQRLRVLVHLDDPEIPTPAVATSAADAGLTLNRWYEMHRRWRERRSLASLGTFATVPRTRTLSHHDTLQRLVVGVVDGLPGASVRQAALALGEALVAEAGIAPEGRPSYNTLRKFAEAEQRRRNRELMPGNELQLDCCACTMPHADGVFVAFLALDRGTRAVIGAALGDPRDSRDGYRRAAVDALARLGADPLAGLGWTDRLERSQVVVGLDGEAWPELRERLSAAGLPGQLRPADSKRRFGMYVRRLLGDRLGRVKFLPGRTTKCDVARASADDAARLAVEVDVHDRDVAAGGGPAGPGRPPASLLAVLRALAS